MKLKTLKDLETERRKEMPPYVFIWILREEAIKWVKWRFKYHTEYKLAEDFINFFNITEEDLK